MIVFCCVLPASNKARVDDDDDVLHEKLPNIRSVFLKFTKFCYFTGNGMRT